MIMDLHDTSEQKIPNIRLAIDCLSIHTEIPSHPILSLLASQRLIYSKLARSSFSFRRLCFSVCRACTCALFQLKRYIGIEVSSEYILLKSMSIHVENCITHIPLIECRHCIYIWYADCSIPPTVSR